MPPIQLLDCTIRDGGYVNNWDFPLPFARALYRALSASRVGWMELGFFDPGYVGGNPWRHVARATVDAVVGGEPGARISLLLNYGSARAEDLPPAEETGVHMLRVATHRADRMKACELAAAAHERGYFATVNLMGISRYSRQEIASLPGLFNEYRGRVDCFYLADSFGSLLPARTRELFDVLRFGTDAALGFHPHNNLQLAFANSLEAMAAGAAVVDGSILGMGRGGGNLFLESALAYLEREYPGEFDLLPVLRFAEIHMPPLRRAHEWGYSLTNLLSGVLDCHPNYPAELLRYKNNAADDAYHVLRGIPADKLARFDAEFLRRFVRDYQQRHVRNRDVRITSRLAELVEAHDRRALLICGGPSVRAFESQIRSLAGRGGHAVVSVNTPDSPVPPDAVFFGNRRRLLQYQSQLGGPLEVVIGPLISRQSVIDLLEGDYSHLSFEPLFAPAEVALPTNSGIEAVYGLVELGFRTILIAGMDGFDFGTSQYHYAQPDAVEAPDEQNAVLRRELREMRERLAPLGVVFAIITPTQFTDFFDPQPLLGAPPVEHASGG